MMKPEAVMEILEAYDLTGSFRAAAAWWDVITRRSRIGCGLRDEAGGMPVVERARPAMEAVFQTKIDELVDRSRGKIRADKAHGKLVALGYQGSERTTRRWVAESKRRWRQKQAGGRGRGSRSQGCGCSGTTATARGWTAGRAVLFCAWLAWSRFRVVVPLRDKTMPSVVMALDRALRMFGGAPTYALTDNEKTVSVDHVCGIAVRNPLIVEVGRHYGLTIATCVPADPESKGGSEATVKVAKADLVPTDHNLRDEYRGLRCARARVRAVHGRRQHAAASRDDGAAGHAAGGGARVVAPAAEAAAHGVFRGDPQGQLAVADLGRRRAVLGPARADRRAGVGPHRR